MSEKNIAFPRLRKQLKKIPGVATLHYAITQFFALRQWERCGKPVPPPHRVKSNAVIEYGKKFHAKNLVETGTFLGHMVNATKNHFEGIFSIELEHTLARNAQHRFRNKRNIKIIEGDSSVVLPHIVQQLSGVTVFWLDAHYSGYVTARGDEDTPILSEIKILSAWNQPHTVLLIDDARLFTGTEYPELPAFIDFLKITFPRHGVSVKDDIIRVIPKVAQDSFTS